MADSLHIRSLVGEYNFTQLAPRNRNYGPYDIVTEMTGAAVGNRFYAYLYELGGYLITQVVVAADGAIVFNNIAAGEYEILVRGQGVYRSEVLGPFTIP